MRNIISITVICILLLTGACSKSTFLTDGDYYFISNEGAKLPVWVKGNFNSDVILITVHGGPGDTGHAFTLSEGFQYLEEDYLMVYWDQRFAGLAQGHPDQSTINLDQYIEDTKKVVELIEALYPGKTFFILGHSWGGQLSAGYLGRDNHDDLFNGWIDLDGSIYGELESQLMKDWILERVPAKMAESDADIEYWQYIIDWYEENPAPGNYTAIEPYIYVGSLKGDAYNWEEVQANNPIPYGELIFNSMFSMSFYVYSHGGDESWVDEANFTPEVEQIDIPVLLLWGAQDGIVPTTVADYVYEHLATPSTDKEIVLIDECAHGPQNDQPEEFYQAVVNFIETYK